MHKVNAVTFAHFSLGTLSKFDLQGQKELRTSTTCQTLSPLQPQSASMMGLDNSKILAEMHLRIYFCCIAPK